MSRDLDNLMLGGAIAFATISGILLLLNFWVGIAFAFLAIACLLLRDSAWQKEG